MNSRAACRCFWRIWRLFTRKTIPLTVYGVATALARNAEAVGAMKEADWEIASHGYRWIDYQYQPEELEREQMNAVTAKRGVPEFGPGDTVATADACARTTAACARTTPATTTTR